MGKSWMLKKACSVQLYFCLSLLWIWISWWQRQLLYPIPSNDLYCLSSVQKNNYNQSSAEEGTYCHSPISHNIKPPPPNRVGLPSAGKTPGQHLGLFFVLLEHFFKCVVLLREYHCNTGYVCGLFRWFGCMRLKPTAKNLKKIILIRCLIPFTCQRF